jgi:Bacterial Ig-like domain (group 2).
LPRYSLIGIALVVALGSACAGSPAAPTGAFTGGGFVTVTGGYQCNVQWAPTGGKPQDVTGLVTWSSSDTSIATVNSTGFVTARSNGSVAIRFSYKGSEGFMTLSVEVAR